MLKEPFDLRPFTVLSRARPRRIAFLINPTECPPELIDALFESNYSIWGGRYNPIVPVVSGEITDSYWDLLHFADPDVIYSYCDLPEDLVRRIDIELCPLEIKRHRWSLPGNGPPHYPPSVCHEQVEISSLVPVVIRREGFGFRKPKLLTSAAGRDWPQRRPILRNIGILDENIAFKPYPENQEKLSISDDWSLERLFEELANEIDPIVFPFQAAEALGEIPEADKSYQYEYCLVIGDHIQDWIYFWNRIFYLSSHRRSRWHTLCISTDSIGNQTFREALKKFLRKFAYRSGNNPDHIDLVSFSVTTEELEQIKRDLFPGVDVIPRLIQIAPNQTHAISIKHRSFPEFYHGGFFIFEQDRTIRQQAASKKCLLKVPDSKVSLDRGIWMMDLRIEYVPEQPFYINEKLWWMLPRDRDIANLFLPGGHTRISEDYSISSQISAQNVFELSIPDEASVIRAALGIGWKFYWNHEVKLEREKAVYSDVALSDKGDYINGVIGLFGGLQDAGNFFQNSFWRSIVEDLSKRRASSEENAIVRIKNKLKKRKEILSNVVAGQDDALEWMSRYVLKLARDQHMLDADISFEVLKDLFLKQREAFIKKNPKFRKESSKTGIEANRKQATNELYRSLQSFTNRGIFRQGVHLRCQHCGSKYWQEISEVRQQNKCQGCGEIVSLSVKADWRYRLNTLIRNAVAFQGCVPVILSLYELRSAPTRYTFLYAPGLEFYKGYDDKKPSAELDLVCISDGKLVIGEVKTSCVEFITKELTKLAEHAKIFGANVIVLGCFQDSKNQINQKKAELEALLGDVQCQVWTIVPLAHVFEPSPHPF